MFGLFKSKEDKEAERIVSVLRENREAMFIEGNVVHELGSMIVNRYKLTASTIRAINIGGILDPSVKDSGAVVIAVSKRETIYIQYDEENRHTRVSMGSSTMDMLKNMKSGLDRHAKKAIEGHGLSYEDISIGAIIGTITALGCEVGRPQTKDENDYPFNYKNHTFSIIEYDNKIWVTYVGKSN